MLSLKSFQKYLIYRVILITLCPFSAPTLTFSFEVNLSPNFVPDSAVLDPSSSEHTSIVNQLTLLLQNAFNCNSNQCTIRIIRTNESTNSVV